ncbi:acetoin utilization protein AcuC [Rhodobacter aestuarii]|uniref:Acetoin utilization protein AcuC n=1 Tax=Rhodobacter aestuarii TaxID=453582 RepID=A0A1N7PJ88_9RHOB|nr:acetoin utilization protein AcuC [Rhodobacter aestuarii]PTV94379.1 acetoin utilization protein AcuC [Rhodobacter aestuarii]SIT10550.1 acetoin utilization protein AcuC [Rhodobacter aestuarii]
MTAHFITAACFRQTGYSGNHPLAIPRVGTVERLCEALGWFGRGHAPLECLPASRAEIARFHQPDYLDAIQRSEAAGHASSEDRARYHIGTLENPVFEGLWHRAAVSVGGAMLAARLAHQGAVAFHPGGGTHHGLRGRASGFCFLNDPVFAILTLLDLGRSRVLYVDFDAHHGDGVELAFAKDPRVMTLSLHEAGRWPFTGGAEDQGETLRNLPLPPRLNDTEFDCVLEKAVLPAARDFAPDAVVVTVGADALLGDPLSSLAITNTRLWAATDAVCALASARVVLGGGGYNPWTLGRAWAGLWARLSGQDIPAQLPKAARSVLESLDCDLVEPEDRAAVWFERIADPENPGPIRPEVEALVAATCGFSATIGRRLPCVTG